MDTKQFSLILTYLQQSLTGARMMGDDEMVTRLSRAIVALEADVEKDIFLDSVIEDLCVPKITQNINKKRTEE